MRKNQNKLKLIRVNPKFIKYLRKYDKKVQLNSKEIHKENKPFVGVLFQINKIEYFVPISSNKKEKLFNMFQNYLKTNQKPIDYCNKHRQEIIKNNIRVYNAVIRHEWETLEKRCCDFKLLEQKCKQYKSNKDK